MMSGQPSPKDPRGKYKYYIPCRIFFCWVDPLFWVGIKRSLDHSDLYAHPSECDSHHLLDKFNRYWSKELERRQRGGSPSLLKVLLKCLWWRILIHGVLLFTEVALIVGVSIMVGLLSDYFIIESPTSTETRDAYLQALGIAAFSLVTVMVHGMGYHYSHYLGMIARVLFSTAVFQKILRLSHTTVSRVTVGHIVNLASNDMHRFDQCFLFYHYFWIGPIHLTVITYLIYLEIQWSAFLATALLVSQVPVQILLLTIFTKLRFKAASLTDKRIKVMNEVITGIRVIKMYAWEYPFRDLVAAIRKSEVWLVLKASLIRSINLSYFTISLPVIMFTVLSVFVSVGGELTPRRVFTTLSLLSFVRVFSLHFVVLGTLFISEARVAFKRIKDFLLLEELPPAILERKGNVILSQHNGDSEHPGSGSNDIPLVNVSENVIVVDNVTVSWSMDEKKPTIEDLSFTVTQSNPLLAVVGTVGAGKSTLLQCLLHELPCLSGSVSVKGTIGYSSQEPWIFSATVRENITFGLPYQSDWYDRVIECCALDKDIDNLPNGDLTLVGERGVTLSGGQKARVNLARAVYRKADIYLLDDPLSAVDAVVSRHIFDRCIRDLLSDKLVVLVTHQLQYVQQCDAVLGLKEGHVTVYGDPMEVLDGRDVLTLLGCSDPGEEGEDPRNAFVVRKNSMTTPSSVDPALDDADVKIRIPAPRQRVLSNIEEVDESELEGADPFLMAPPPVDAISYHSVVSYQRKDDEEDLKKESSHQKVVAVQSAEERAHGVISLKTYYKFFRAGGNQVFIAFVFIVFLFAEGNIVSADWWISDWAQCQSEGTNSSLCLLSNQQRIGIYGGLVGGVIITTIVRYCCFIALVVNASRNLHNQMFASVSRAPVLFFDTNPIGRILNRFSKDVGFLDDLLPYVFCEYLLLVVRTLAIIITAIAANPYTVISVFFLLLTFVGMRWYYLKTGRDIKRLEALARSPVYSHISLTLQGLSTIRSYSMQSESQRQFHTYQNRHSQGWYLYLVTVRWFGMRIDLVSAIFISIVAFTSVPLSGSLSASLVGLALTYTVTLNGMFQYCIRQSAEVENLMVSAERVMAYTKLEPEASLETEPPTDKPPSDWPLKGLVELEDLSYRHSSEGPLVLKGVSCTIKSGEKIGIVGRTGAGKSSLISALFRLAEPHGILKVDNVDISSLGLHDIRSKLSIIPQDPVLFGGTIRYNLDPFGVYDDESIWTALDQVQLKSVVQSQEGQLEAEVHEGGGNFSVGQRQLFCLARALLRNNKILIMDEATANVDLETDAIIQRVIREQFGSCTILTVAHRLDTVMDSDRIMVLRAGLLCEFDEPHVLLSDSSSYLHRLVEHTGVDAANKLKEMALTAYNKRRKVSE